MLKTVHNFFDSRLIDLAKGRLKRCELFRVNYVHVALNFLIHWKSSLRDKNLREIYIYISRIDRLCLT